MKHFAIAVTLAIAGVFLASCATNPVSGKSELALISESQEIEMGRQAAAAAEAQLGLVDDSRMQDYVQRLQQIHEINKPPQP